jgi:hypothetical protein
MNLGSVLKMLGVKIEPVVIAKIEAAIPQMPALVNAVVARVNTFDERIRFIEIKQAACEDLLLRILREVESGRFEFDGDRPAGIGATQRAIESVGSVNGPG